MEVIRRFYRLPDLAERWGCSVNDLLHAASIGHLPLHVDSAGFVVRTLVRTPTDPQPNPLRLRGALFLLDRKVARELEQPGAFPFKLNIASYWPDRTSTKSWVVEFFPALEISAGHLCVWREHAEQYWKEVNKKEATSDQSLKTVERDSLLKIVLGMATAAPYGFDASAKRNEATAIIASATGAAGCPVDVDTVRKWLKLAAKEHGKPNTGSN